jgi:hypothetical protein
MDINEEFEIITGEVAKPSEINEASEVEIKSMDKKSQLAIKYWTKVFHGKPITAWDGIHGLIVKIQVQSILKQRVRSETLEYLMKSGAPKFRWIEFDKGTVDIGFYHPGER